MRKLLGMMAVAVCLLMLTASMTWATRFMHEPCDIKQYSPAALTEEQKSHTGCALLMKGWKEAVRCDGHSWSYLMKKDNQYMRCNGIDSRGRPTEEPCSPFEGGIEQFKAQCDNTGDKK